MSEDLPIPFVSAEIDISKLDGFMLNTERLLGSDLVALATGDEFKAAVLLWCRAWKQRPAASLPDNDKILASFAGVPVTKWKKLRERALHGFIKCSDGRLYHPVLAADALRAHKAAEQRRQAINKRWSKNETDTGQHTAVSPPNEVRTSEPIPKTGQGRDGEEEKKDSVPDGTAPLSPLDLEKQFWATAKHYLGDKSGSLIGKWRKEFGPEAVMRALSRAQAENPTNPIEFIIGCLRSGNGRRMEAGGAGVTPTSSLYAGAALALARRAQRSGDCGADIDPAEPLLDGERGAGAPLPPNRRLA